MKQFKKTLLALLTLTFLTTTGMRAQNDTLLLSNGNFANWSSEPGYSIPVLFFSWPVYSAYTYPTGWNYPSYPFNESLSYSGININIDTNVPLLKVSQSNSSADGDSSSVKMESFMLSDIIGYSILNIAYSYLDSELVHSVFPSILATGGMDVDNMLSILDVLLENANNANALLTALSTLNMNDYFSGGIALNGFHPSRLAGSYRYHAANDSIDNGGVLLLGTRYNAITHRREVVGGGINSALTDTADFTGFEVPYISLSQDTSKVADSLIVVLISSCNDHRLRGSALYLDNLMLIEDPAEPDTCANIQSVEVSGVTTTEGTLTWHSDPLSMNWEYRYGISGNTLSIAIETTDSTVSLIGLQSDTEYEFQVRAKCDEELYSEWAVLYFRTDTLPTVIEDSTGVGDYISSPILLYPNPANGFCNIRNNSGQTYKAELTTPEGKMLQIITLEPGESRLDLPYSGLLLLNIATDGIRHTHKILNLK